ncbi:NLRC3, partial [Symbiodinium necroappetens]
AWTGKVRIKALAYQLTTKGGTTHLDLHGQQITDEGCQALAGAFKSNCTVTYVDLRYNMIGGEGAEALADAWKSNHSVTHIDLRFNYIGDEGAKALADALKSNRTVTHVNLRFNEIGDEGRKARRPRSVCSLQFRAPLSCERHSEMFGSSTMLSSRCIFKASTLVHQSMLGAQGVTQKNRLVCFPYSVQRCINSGRQGLNLVTAS